MLLTRECDYAMRIVRALADGMKKHVAAICHDELMPVQYAYKIMKKLERAGLVRSVRGREGGYVLQRSVQELTPYDVIVAVEERPLVTDCLRSDAQCPRNTGDAPCSLHGEFARVQAMLEVELKRWTFHELLNEKN